MAAASGPMAHAISTSARSPWVSAHDRPSGASRGERRAQETRTSTSVRPRSLPSARSLARPNAAPNPAAQNPGRRGAQPGTWSRPRSRPAARAQRDRARPPGGVGARAGNGRWGAGRERPKRERASLIRRRARLAAALVRDRVWSSSGTMRSVPDAWESNAICGGPAVREGRALLSWWHPSPRRSLPLAARRSPLSARRSPLGADFGPAVRALEISSPLTRRFRVCAHTKACS
jgi:hypothetical protein